MTPQRADARRNLDALLEAAREVFAESGVDAPAKEITDRAGVGVGTLYRHFPQRSDLVLAVLEHEIDACADAAATLAEAHPPAEALRQWAGRYTDLVATKTGLASALHSHDDLRAHFYPRMRPALGGLLTAAIEAGAVRPDVSPDDLLHAIPLLCRPIPGEPADYGRHLTGIFLDGLRPMEGG